jgi:hypothetical protein
MQKLYSEECVNLVIIEYSITNDGLKIKILQPNWHHSDS